MSDVQKLAKQIFRDEHPDRFPYCPYGKRPELRDLWECDQEQYIKRAEAELRRRWGNP